MTLLRNMLSCSNHRVQSQLTATLVPGCLAVLLRFFEQHFRGFLPTAAVTARRKMRHNEMRFNTARSECSLSQHLCFGI